jgi:hypothetical protein
MSALSSGHGSHYTNYLSLFNWVGLSVKYLEEKIVTIDVLLFAICNSGDCLRSIIVLQEQDKLAFFSLKNSRWW